MKNINSILSIFLIVMIGITSCSTEKDKKSQPELGTRSAGIIEKHGLKFKDLNKNGKLDKYEDWRLTAEERSKDLLSKMSLEEKAGFMVINSLNMVVTRRASESDNKLAPSDLDEGGGSQSGRTDRSGQIPAGGPGNKLY